MDILGLFLLLVLLIIVFGWTCQTSMEAFEGQYATVQGESVDYDLKMRPWFGYEPGYGPGWGRKGCCNVPVPPNMNQP